MGTITKKITSVVLSATTVVWISGIAMIAPIAQAQSTTDLQSQINALLSQISALQAQLSANQNPSAYVQCTFTRNLTVGVVGEDVRCLQRFLNDGGFSTVFASGAGRARGRAAC